MVEVQAKQNLGMLAERDALVEQIKAEHPYPDEPAVSEMEIVEQEPETQE